LLPIGNSLSIESQARPLTSLPAAELEDNLGTVVPKPDSLRQSRPLISLPADDQKKVWQEAPSFASGTSTSIGLRARLKFTARIAGESNVHMHIG